MKCRSCNTEVNLTWADLRTSPPSNSFLSKNDLQLPETYYPLVAKVCTSCWLAQVDEHKNHEEIFSRHYVYFSSFSKSWLNHAEKYVHKMIKEFSLTPAHQWVEIASNDGYLLQFVKKSGIPCYGVEPTESTAKAAREKGIETFTQFFGVKTAQDFAKSKGKVQMMSANNVLAHVPDIHDFVGGFRELLADQGVATFEFPHLLNLLKLNQFDTIYHEHFSYLSLNALVPLFKSENLRVFKVEQIETHGGSLRVYVTHKSANHAEDGSVHRVLSEEKEFGLQDKKVYIEFQKNIEKIKNDLLEWLLEQKKLRKKVVAYGAAAKGNTLLNYAGIGADLIQMVADASPHKQNLFLPGCRIPVVSPDKLISEKPDAVLILPWNLKNEIIESLRPKLSEKVQFVTAVPQLSFF